MYPIILQVPRYAAHLEKQDLTSTFEWQKRILKLLQSRYKKKHWLMKSPSHLPHLRKLLSVFPDMRIIFTHRDPLASADSVASFMGNMRSEEHTSELQSLMRISYAVFCLKKK